MLRQFEKLGLLKALPKTPGNFREVRRYRLTIESLEFQTLLVDLHEHVKTERDLERKLRSEMKRVPSTPTRHPEPAPYPSTTLSSVVDCGQGARYTAVDCAFKELKISEASIQSIQLGRGVENKATWEVPRFTVVDRELELAQRIALNPTVARIKQVFNARIVDIVDLKQQAANGLQEQSKSTRRRGTEVE